MAQFDRQKQLFRLFCLLLLCFSTAVMGQNQTKADSLKALLASNPKSITITGRMDLMSLIAANSSSPDEVLTYSNKLLALASKEKVSNYMIDAYHYKGVAYRLKGNLKNALENLFISATLAFNNKQYELQAEAYEEIANTYAANNDLKNALLYNRKALQIIRLHGNDKQLAINLLNTGYNYYMLKQLDSALSFYNEAEPIFDTEKLAICKAYTIGNRALVYWKQGKQLTAEKDLIRAINMLVTLRDEFGMADYHNQLGQLYSEQGHIEQAIEQTNKGLTIAKTLDLKEQIRDATLLLSKLYNTKKNYQQAYDYQSQYLLYKDSIENTETTKQIADLRTEFEVSLKEKQIVLLEKHQLLNRIYIIIAIALLLIALLVLLYFRQRFQNTRLMAENERKQHDEKIRSLLIAHETKTLQTMVQGQEKERKRLAQELHNHFGSLLATIKVNLNAIDEKAISNHHTLTTLVDRACTDIRNMSHALNMGISDDFGLVPALKELTTHLQQANGLEVEFSASMCNEQMGAVNEIIIYRIVQELVSNVLKHSQATKLSILLTCFDDDNLINILVQDNGIGFDPEKEKTEDFGMGLKSLQQMIADLQGEIRFDSNPISGTTVNIDLPYMSINT